MCVDDPQEEASPQKQAAKNRNIPYCKSTSRSTPQARRLIEELR